MFLVFLVFCQFFKIVIDAVADEVFDDADNDADDRRINKQCKEHCSICSYSHKLLLAMHKKAAGRCLPLSSLIFGHKDKRQTFSEAAVL
jgi:uncharacterized protein YuzB (UPF0349 family)